MERVTGVGEGNFRVKQHALPTEDRFRFQTEEQTRHYGAITAAELFVEGYCKSCTDSNWRPNADDVTDDDTDDNTDDNTDIEIHFDVGRMQGDELNLKGYELPRIGQWDLDIMFAIKQSVWALILRPVPAQLGNTMVYERVGLVEYTIWEGCLDKVATTAGWERKRLTLV